MEEILNSIIEAIIKMDSPEYVSALRTIGQICHEKADVLTNLQSIQNQFNAAKNSIDRCNERLKELVNK